MSRMRGRHAFMDQSVANGPSLVDVAVDPSF